MEKVKSITVSAGGDTGFIAQHRHITNRIIEYIVNKNHKNFIGITEGSGGGFLGGRFHGYTIFYKNVDLSDIDKYVEKFYEKSKGDKRAFKFYLKHRTITEY